MAATAPPRQIRGKACVHHASVGVHYPKGGPLEARTTTSTFKYQPYSLTVEDTQASHRPAQNAPLSPPPPLLPETLPQSTYCLGYCKPTCGNQRNPNFVTSTNWKFLYSTGPAPYYGISRHLDCSKLFQLQVMCKTPSQRLEALGVVSDLISLCRFHGCVRSNQQCPHSSAESEIIPLDAGGRTDGMPALYFRECDVETLMCTRATGCCEQMRHRQIFPTALNEKQLLRV